MRDYEREASASFFEKKEAKKLLLLWAMGAPTARTRGFKNFLRAFF
jgi:hypothetical protein